jgi:hypothetical protein
VRSERIDVGTVITGLTQRGDREGGVDVADGRCDDAAWPVVVHV